MATSILSLFIGEGPKKGKSFEYQIGTLIRIGRVVRGNTLAIRDPSISQNHLIIQFLPEITRWAVTDLGSSNGTYVNGSLISPDDRIPLADGDVLVIGEKTSISVKVSSTEAVLPPLPRRWKVRRSDTVEKVVLPEEKVSQPVKNRGSGRKRGRLSNRFLRKNNSLELEAVEQRAGRVTRSSARAVSATVSKNQEVEEYGGTNISDSDCGVLAEKEKASKDSHASAEQEELVIGRVGEAMVEEVEYDMDNMKLGEWFDRMETYLAKAINDVAVEAIASLREKSWLFHEFVIHTASAGPK